MTQELVDRLVAEAKTLGADAIVVTTEARGTRGAVGTNDVANVQTADSATARVEVRALKHLR